MSDVVFVAIIVVFFALSVMLVRFCDWLIGPADASSTDVEVSEELRGSMSYDNVLALVLSLLVTVYLIVALVFPEKL